MNTVKITKENFIKYLKVKHAGNYNMLTREARKQTGLSLLVYKAIQENYELLTEVFQNKNSISLEVKEPNDTTEPLIPTTPIIIITLTEIEL